METDFQTNAYVNMTEAETREIIDRQLRLVGWEADTLTLRYSKGIRPQSGRFMAIAEWPTLSGNGERGFADYVLFYGTRILGIIEAKARHKDIPAIIDNQCKEYAGNIRPEDRKYVAGQWGDYQVPFVFATNGRPYLKQLETKSGIWFLDLRRPDNVPRALRGWMSPDGLLDLLRNDSASADQKLKAMSYDFLTDADGLNLRHYQLEAIRAAENAVVNGRENILLAMATGTGKTRTVLGLVYRFLKSGRFRRILFLVDRNSLGNQAGDVFREVRLEELMSLDKLYNIQFLDGKAGLQDEIGTTAAVDKETRLHIATVQSMVRRIINNGNGPIPAVSDYDLLIIDEAHRGYILDREMGEDELLYRDQLDYQSKYRAVIEYFNAVKIALTATPALQTTEIFGQPVFKYTYREAVIDGYLVDHDAPHEIITRLSKEGIHYRCGDTVTKYDPVTGEVTNAELLADELDFDIDNFNRQVITESFNRTVLKEIARNIDPEIPDENGKTLIYAVNDQHADLIVKILKEIYAETGVDNSAIVKITDSIGNQRNVDKAIKQFKNERYPSIVVTVDLLTTGVDVPQITNLVFLRRVKSRILFEQMLGRATRLCPAIHKTHFEIYDAVGVYAALNDVSTMKPVVTNPATTFEQLLRGLSVLEDEQHVRQQVALITAKLQRRRQNMDGLAMEQFRHLSDGQDLAAIAADLKTMDFQNSRKYLLNLWEALSFLDKGASGHGNLVISEHEDQVLEHTRGYGNADRPEDYLDAFADYVRNNVNRVAALNIICTRPRELTRENLKSLLFTLDQQGFTPKLLNTAICQMTNVEITADIISIIRRYALGSALLPHEERIHSSVERLRKSHNFTRQELNWIGRIEKYLLEEMVLNIAVFDEDSRFKAQGGFNKINKVFANKLENIITELNNYLYDDGGVAA